MNLQNLIKANWLCLLVFMVTTLVISAQNPSTTTTQPKIQIFTNPRERVADAQKSLFNLRSMFDSTGQRFGAFTDRKCLMCKFSVSLINYALKTSRGYDQVDRLANNFCNIAHLESPLVCSQVSKLFNHEITKVLTYGIVTPNQVCGLLSNNTCGHFHSPLDDWQVHLEASQRLVGGLSKRKQQQNNNNNNTATNTETYRVIHMSDTHVDLRYAVGSLAKCAEPLCCRQSSTPINESSQPLMTSSLEVNPLGDEHSKAGTWGSYGHCDVPMRTFESALKFINRTLESEKDIDYIIWTGDIQPHDVWSQNKKSAIQVFDAVFAKIFAYLPSVKILPTLGNHEMIPVDSFSPSNLLDIARDDSPIWLYRKLDSFWSHWLPSDTAKTITRDGFYSTKIRPNLKVISLNTNFCHTKNFWLFINSTDPGQQLQWLVHELQMSELLDEKVHIIGHIPPGSDDCMKVWSKNYNKILRRYESTVTGQFFGHTHTNEFEMFYAPQDPVKVAASTQAPILTAGVEPSPGQLSSSERQQKKQQVISTLSSLNSTLAQNGNNLTKAIIDSAEAKSLGRSQASPSGVVVSDVPKLKPIGVGFIGPSITTFIGLNPSLRIYTIEPKRNFMPTNYETFYMNLTQANAQTNSTQEPQWQSAGLFTKLFNISDTSPESMHGLLIDIVADINLEADDDELTVDSIRSTTLAREDSNDQDDDDDDNSDDDNSDGQEDEDDEDSADDKLFSLFRLYNSYSDQYDRAVYDHTSAEDKRKFLCRLFTGQAHDATACKEFIPTITVVSIANSTITV